MTGEMQSLMFDRKIYTVGAAVKWLRAHGYRGVRVDETKNYLRFRQSPPSRYTDFRTVKLTEGIKAVVGIRKNPDRTQTGIENARRIVEEQGYSFDDVVILRTDADYKKMCRRYGLPNMVSEVGPVGFGRGGALFVDDDDNGRPVAYIPSEGVSFL